MASSVTVDGDGDIVRGHLLFAQTRGGELQRRFERLWDDGFRARFFED